jgi:hypothetical protein
MNDEFYLHCYGVGMGMGYIGISWRKFYAVHEFDEHLDNIQAHILKPHGKNSDQFFLPSGRS